MRILGIDPGTRKAGYGVIDLKPPGFSYIECGTIELDAKMSMPERLLELANHFNDIVEEYKPDIIALEDVFVHENVRSALKLNLARGVIMMCAAKRGLKVKEHPPANVKKAVTGRGNATKQMVQKRIQLVCKLNNMPVSDAADAVAVAICEGGMA